jgi:hypothetical protein
MTAKRRQAKKAQNTDRITAATDVIKATSGSIELLITRCSYHESFAASFERSQFSIYQMWIKCAVRRTQVGAA